MTAEMNKAWRAGAAAALALLATACGRPAQQAASGAVEVNGRQVELAQLQKDAERAEKGAQKGTRALAPAGVKDLLPASVGGFTRAEVQTMTGPEPGMARADARYMKGAAGFLLSVTDFGASGAVGASGDAQGATTERKTMTGYEKVTTAGGRMVTEQWDTAASTGRYSIVAADRYAITAEGSADKVEVLKAAVEAVNLARLKALAG